MDFLASLDKKRWATVAVTLGLALASGYLMEHVLSERTAKTQTEAPLPIPVPPSAMQVPALRTPPIVQGRTKEERYVRSEAQGCRPRLFVNPAPAATLRIDLYAPCQPNAPVTLRQGKVVAALSTDARGRLTVRLPAFAAETDVALDLEGETLTGRATVAEAVDYRHVVLAWEGAQMLRINAYEFGASKREMGHVWSGAPQSPARSLTGAGGFLTRLGDGTGPSAEIYSFPVGRTKDHGVVRLVVEAEVTEESCDRELHGQAYQTGLSGQLVRTEIALAMPACDRLGEIVRLQNLLQDMRLAGR